MAEVLVPLRNANIAAARDAEGTIIGIEVRCLFLHHEISSLPEMLMESAYHVLDKEAARDAGDSGL